MHTKLILVGGFLGAGKTTLLHQAGQRLAAAGKRVGLITNDQAPDLVDTGMLAQNGGKVREVAGSCFCCDFPGLLEAAQSLEDDEQVDVIVGEPVGSCTDLSATILQPLKDKHRAQFELSPLSVLVDPYRLRSVLVGNSGGLHDSAAYILRKQAEEADVIVINKRDLLTGSQVDELRRLIAAQFDDVTVIELSALNDTGIDAWLEHVMSTTVSGRKLLDIDYDTYAEGEAVLGWLNASVRLSAEQASIDWRTMLATFMRGLRDTFAAGRHEVGHLKMLLTDGTEQTIANLTRVDDDVSLRGTAPAAATVDLIINARVEMSPDKLEEHVRHHLAQAAEAQGVQTMITHLQCLSPGRPRPTHRYSDVV